MWRRAALTSHASQFRESESGSGGIVMEIALYDDFVDWMSGAHFFNYRSPSKPLYDAWLASTKMS